MEDLVQFTKQAYGFFCLRLYTKADKWTYGQVNGKTADKSIRGFIQHIEDKYEGSARADYIWFFLCYSFRRYELVNFRPNGFVNYITPSMIFGQKSIQKFGNRTSIDTLVINAPYLLKYNINKQEFVRKEKFTFTADLQKVNDKKVEKRIQQYIDPIKKVTIKTKLGPDMCFELTDLYNDQDPSCQVCPYAKECKEYLKKVNPRVYKLRDYE